MENVKLTQDYDGVGGGYNSMIRTLNNIILTHKDRGSDRDVLFVDLGGWDHHQEMKTNLADGFQNLNTALTLFVKEMQAQNIWNNVTLVVTSEFGRTLTANSNDGSDHAWGGNYFLLGGDVQGGQILGQYPSDITEGSSELNIGRGRLIPTSSWESLWNGVLEWMGLDDENDLDYSMPNRRKTGTKLYTREEMFVQ